MKARDRDRLRGKMGLLGAYLRSLNPDFGKDAPRDGEGRRVFVSCLVDDTVHSVVRLVTQAGGSALVCAFDVGKKSISLTTCTLTCNETHDGGEGSCPVGPATTLADLFSILTPGASMTLRLDGDAMFIDKRDEIPVDKKAAELARV